jgi:hypothetical protein
MALDSAGLHADAGRALHNYPGEENFKIADLGDKLLDSQAQV